MIQYQRLLYIYFIVTKTDNYDCKAFDLMVKTGSLVKDKSLMSSQLGKVIYNQGSWRHKAQKKIDNFRFFLRKKLLQTLSVDSDLIASEEDMNQLKEAIAAMEARGSLRRQQRSSNGNPQTILEFIMYKLDFFDKDSSFFEETTAHLEAFVLAHLKYVFFPSMRKITHVSERKLLHNYFIIIVLVGPRFQDSCGHKAIHK